MTGPYRRWIADYRNSGLHPFPVDGKRPCVTAYGARRPGPAALDRWTETFPLANLGLPTRRERLAVLDADDPAAIELFKYVAGDTPLRVLTRRGEHWYFADPTAAIASAVHPNGQPFDIRASGKADYVLGLAYRFAVETDFDGEITSIKFVGLRGESRVFVWDVPYTEAVSLPPAAPATEGVDLPKPEVRVPGADEIAKTKPA